MSDTSYYGLYDPLAVPADMQQTPPTRITVRPEDANRLDPPAPEQAGVASRTINKLLGVNGEERYQTWPERTVRSGFTLPHDVMTGQEPTTAVDPITGDTVPSPHMLERTQDLAGMAMSGGLAGAGEGGMIAGSGPVRTSTMRNSEIPTATAREQQLLRKAVRESGDDRPFDKHPRQEVPIKDLVATQDEVSPEIVQQKIQGGEYKGENDAFAVLHDGKYYIEDGHHTVEAARRMGRETVPMHVQVLNAKNEAAAPLAALEKGPVWHSPVENALEQSTTGSAPGRQWLATLQNARGVKPEELEWTGLRDFLTEHADDKVTRQELHEHMARNRVELQDVEKGQKTFDDLTPGQRDRIVEDYAEYHGLDDHSEIGNADPRIRAHWEAMREEDPQSVVGTKYHDYQLPGGENYREHLLTLPEKNAGASPELRSGMSMEEYERAPPAGNYKSSHWDEPNIVAHVRTNDRMMPAEGFVVRNSRSGNGSEVFATRQEADAYRSRLPESVQSQTEVQTAQRPVRSLHIEEVQSDWHQAGRKQGYKQEFGPSDVKERKAPGGDTQYYVEAPNAHGGRTRHWETPEDALREANQSNPNQSVPDAPFKTTWPELAMRRMVRRAAEEGYDRISWTPGEAQAARYDLSKQVSKIEYDKSSGYLGGYDLNGHRVMDKYKIKPEELPNLIGKEAADRILNNPTSKVMERHSLEGADLKVGGEGMREFYDKMLPRVAEKIGRAHGVKVQRGEIITHRGFDTARYQVFDKDGHHVKDFTDNNEAHRWMEDPANGVRNGRVRIGQAAQVPSKTAPIHYFDIPPSLRDQALQKGMPLFSGGKMFIPATQPQKKDDQK